MSKNFGIRFSRYANYLSFRWRHTILFFACLILFIGTPLIEESTSNLLTTDIFSCVLLLASMVVLSRSIHMRLLAVVLASLSILALWLERSFTSHYLDYLEIGCEVTLYLMVLSIVVSDLIKDKEITLDHILGAVSGYFILGFFWFQIYNLMELLYTHPIIGFSGRSFTEAELLYFSFSTLVTLGFGDILPTGILMRHLTILEAISGQLYIAILMARLVGLNLHFTVSNNIRGRSKAKNSRIKAFRKFILEEDVIKHRKPGH